MKNRAEDWYRLLAGVLPRGFRQGFEDEMAHDFLMRLRNKEGLPGRAAVWAGAILDLLVQGVSERLPIRRRELHDRRKRGKCSLFDSLGRDVRYAGRILRRSPSFTVIATLTLALGIGGVTLAFSLVDGVLLRPLPFPQDDELVVLRQQKEGKAELLSFPNYDDLRTQTQSFKGIAALRFPADATILGGSEPARGTVVPVSREFFSVLGVKPFIGRPVLPAENRPGGDPVAVVGYEFWARFLGSDETLEKIRLTITGTVYSVAGVMPPGFKVLEDADVYLPLEHDAFMKRSSSNYRGIGRIADGITRMQAQAELDAIAARIREAYPQDARMDRFVMKPLREEVLGDLTRPLFLLLGASGLLLLLACSNAASTLMARSVHRRKEMAIRSALGGGRARLARMVFTESLLLAALAGAAGVGLALTTLKIVKSAGAGFIPRMAAVSMDGSVLAFALGATVATSLLFGLLPALHLPEPASALRTGSAGNSQTRGRLGWNLLVGGQVALALCLVVASGLLLRSMREILSADTHFRPQGVLTIALDFSAAGYSSPAERGAKLVELKSELSAMPGVRDVGFVSHLPNERGMMTGGVFRPPMPVSGYPDHWAGGVGWRVVDQDYFRAMGIPLLEGRFFTSQDRPDSRPVIILNETLARALFPDREATGALVRFEPFWKETDLEVAGIVAEARDWRVPEGEQMEGFVLLNQRPGYTRYMTAVLRTSGNPASLIAPARERLQSLAPNVPGTFRTMESLLADSVRDRAFTLGVLGAFAFLSLFLSAVGIYGVVSYTVSAQAREIGIMLALGAQRRQVRTKIVLRSMRVVAAGVVAGVGLAVMTGGLLQGLLYQVQPQDPATMVAAPLVLLVSAFFAILLPVVRHTRVDPISAMKAE